MERRHVLATGASALAAALAGCTTGGGSDGDGDGTTTNPDDDGNGGDATVVTVGPGGQYAFDPEQVTVSTGTTVRWEWASGGHNVVVDSQPSDANWEGTAGGSNQTYGSDHTYEFTFEVSGTYEYACSPHRTLGMRGSVVVE